MPKRTIPTPAPKMAQAKTNDWYQQRAVKCIGSRYRSGTLTHATEAETSACKGAIAELWKASIDSAVHDGHTLPKVFMFGVGRGKSYCSNKAICRAICPASSAGCKWKVKVDRFKNDELIPSVSGVHDTEAHRLYQQQKATKVRKKSSSLRSVGRRSSITVENEFNRGLVQYLIDVQRQRREFNPDDRIAMSFCKAIASVREVRSSFVCNCPKYPTASVSYYY